MTESNKGRFKVADEAQAVFNFVLACAGVNLKDVHMIDERNFEMIANALHQAHLIHGSIYDEHGRIEDKDVAHLLCNYAGFDLSEWSWYFSGFDHTVRELLKSGAIRGTIFY